MDNYTQLKRGEALLAGGALPAIILALTCLVAAAYHIKILLDLNQRGISVNAMVADMPGQKARM